MDFTKPLTFAGLSINTVSRTAGGVPMSGYLVEEFDPSVIDVAAFLSKRALQDGLDASDVYLGGRNIGLVVTVFGSTIGDFWDKSQALFAAFSPTLNLSADTANLGFRALTFYQPTENTTDWPSASYPDGIPMQYYVRPVAPPRFVQRRDEEGGTNGLGLSKQFRIALLAKDPRKYSQNAVTVSVSTSSATAINRGDYPVRPTVTIQTAAATGNVVVNIGGNAFTVLANTASADYAISLLDGTVTRNGVLRMDLLLSGSLDIELQPGSTVVSGSAPSGATVGMTFRHGFA